MTRSGMSPEKRRAIAIVITTSPGSGETSRVSVPDRLALEPILGFIAPAMTSQITAARSAAEQSRNANGNP